MTETALFVPLSQSRANAALAIGIIFWALATITVALRFWTRSFIVRVLGIDDWLMLLALVLYTVWVALIEALTVMSAFGHNLIIDFSWSLTLNLLLTSEIFYVVIMLVLKLSLGFFFLRIVPTDWQRYVVHGVMGVTTAFSLAYFFFAVFQCGVPDPFWIKRVLNQCVPASSSSGMGFTHATITAFSDLILVCLPIPIIIKSTLKMREKAIITGILCLAAVSSIASFVRFPYIPILDAESLDIWNSITILAIFSIIECGLGIIAGSLATLRPLVRSMKWNLTLFSDSPSENPNSNLENDYPSLDDRAPKSLEQYDEEASIDNAQEMMERDERIRQSLPPLDPYAGFNTTRPLTPVNPPTKAHIDESKTQPLPTRHAQLQQPIRWFRENDTWFSPTDTFMSETDNAPLPEEETILAEDKSRSRSRQMLGRRTSNISRVSHTSPGPDTQGMRNPSPWGAMAISSPPPEARTMSVDTYTLPYEAQDSYVGWARAFTGSRDGRRISYGQHWGTSKNDTH